MKNILLLCLLMVYCPLYAQMRVYTVAGKNGAPTLGDGGPATAAQISGTEGIWLDGNCNVYHMDNSSRMRKTNTNTGIITTFAGGDKLGYTGDNGLATNARITAYGLFADKAGNVYIPDPNNNVIRRIDNATGIINTIAGGGSSLGDGGPATAAQFNEPRNVYLDDTGNLYIAEQVRIRKINKAGIITTIAGTGVDGLSGDGGPATAAKICLPHTMILDDRGNFFFADRCNNRIRKIDSKGIITTYAGSTDGYSGDGGPATAAQLSGPISFVIDYSGGMVIGDNQNDVMRRVDPGTGIITHFAGVGIVGGSLADGALATEAKIHPEFMYLDRSGNIYFTCFCGFVRKITNYLPSLAATDNGCGETAVPEVAGDNTINMYPNPATNELHLQVPKGVYIACTITNTIGQRMLQQPITQAETTIPTVALPPGMYFITLAGDGGMKTLRFVKE